VLREGVGGNKETYAIKHYGLGLQNGGYGSQFAQILCKFQTGSS
jgi:hypothetical protein